MGTALIYLYAISLIGLLIFAAARPTRSKLSDYELELRIRAGETAAKIEHHKRQHIPDIEAIMAVKRTFFLIASSLLALEIWGWGIGLTAIIIMIMFYQTATRFPGVRQVASFSYRQIEPLMVQIISRYPKIFRTLRGVNGQSQSINLGSKQELLHLVEQSHGVLTDDEKSLITHSLRFEQKRVESIMTPRDEIITVAASDMLGPLVLDELHKTNHSRFPVIKNGSLDQVAGVVHISDLLSLHNKKSITAEKAMDPHVQYIRSDHTLTQALHELMRTRHHLLIVVDEKQHTVGLISLDDVIESLIGRRLRH